MENKMLIIKEDNKCYKSIYKRINTQKDFIFLCLDEIDKTNDTKYTVRNEELYPTDKEGYYIILNEGKIQVIYKQFIISKGMVYDYENFVIKNIISYYLINLNENVGDILDNITEINVELTYEELTDLFINHNFEFNNIKRWALPNEYFIKHFRGNINNLEYIKISKKNFNVLSLFNKLEKVEIVDFITCNDFKLINTNINEVILHDYMMLPNILKLMPTKLKFSTKTKVLYPSSETIKILSNTENIKELTISKVYRKYINSMKSFKNSFIIYI